MDRIAGRDSAFLLATGVGLLFVVTTLSVLAYGSQRPLLEWFSTGIVWILGGQFLFGVVPTYVASRYRIRSPVFLAVGLYVFALVISWWTRVMSTQPEAANTPGIVSLYGFLLIFWPLFLLGTLLIGVLEYDVRRRDRRTQSVS